MKKRTKIILALGGIILFALLAILIFTDRINSFDIFIYRIVAGKQNNIITGIYKFLSFLCSVYFLIILLGLMFFLFKDKKIFLGIVLNLFLCLLLNFILKNIFTRPRPVKINLIVEKGYSFPSAHAMISLAFYGLIIYLINLKSKNKKTKIFLSLALSLVIFSIGVSRIYLGVHYASDVLAGFAISITYLICFIEFIFKRKGFISKKS